MVTAQENDPQNLVDEKRRLGGAIAGRFRDLKGLVIADLIERDALGLSLSGSTAVGESSISVTSGASHLSETRGSDAEKVAAVGDWLRRATTNEVLETEPFGNDISGNHYTSTYVTGAYETGIRHADRSARAAGYDVPDEEAAAVAGAGNHANRIESHNRRVVDDLRGVTTATATQATRQFSDEFSSGNRSRYQLADEINDRVDKIGITRGRTLARVGLARAHHDGSMERFGELGIELVTGRAEHVRFTTAGDSGVCAQCRFLEGNVYTLEEARGMIPQHPGCRCVFLPANPPS